MSLAGLLNQEVQIKARTGTTYTGDPEYAAAATSSGPDLLQAAPGLRERG